MSATHEWAPGTAHKAPVHHLLEYGYSRNTGSAGVQALRRVPFRDASQREHRNVYRGSGFAKTMDPQRGAVGRLGGGVKHRPEDGEIRTLFLRGAKVLQRMRGD